MSLPLAAFLASLLLFGIAGFHAALALGVRWSAYAWGGQAEPGPLPPRLQLGSTILAPLVASMGVLLLVRGGWIYATLASTMAWPAWAVFLFVISQFFGALRSRSVKERRRMTPVYGLAAVFCAIVAFGNV